MIAADALDVLVEERLVFVAAEEPRRPSRTWSAFPSTPATRSRPLPPRPARRAALPRCRARRTRRASCRARRRCPVPSASGCRRSCVGPDTASARIRPALMCSANSPRPDDTGGDMAADDRSDRFATALEWNVVDLGRIGADRLGDQPDQDVIGTACRAAAPRHLARIGLEGLDAGRPSSCAANWLARRSTTYSLVSRAIGVTIARSTGDLFSMMPPTITMPPIINAFGSPLALLTNCASPIVPAAPPLLSNCTDWTSFCALHRRAKRAPGLVPAAARIGRDHHFDARRAAAHVAAAASGQTAARRTARSPR